MKVLLTLLLLFTCSLTAPLLPAQEKARSWTNDKGQSLQAVFVSQDDKSVTLLLKGGREYKMEKAKLSEADQEYLAGLMKAEEPSTPDKPGEEKKEGEPAKPLEALPADFKPVPGHPEADAKTDEKTFEVVREDFEGGKVEDYFEARSIKTEHFLILHDPRNTKADDIAVLAEQLYAGISQQHFGLQQKFGKKRYLILVATEAETWSNMGQWYRDTPKWTDSQERTWKKYYGHTIKIKDEFQQSGELLAQGTALSGVNDDHVTGKFPGIATHKLTYDLMTLILGADDDAAGIYPFTVGQAYFKESVLSDAATYKILDKSDYTRDKFAAESDFARGTNWAKTLRNMVRKEEIKPDLGDVFEKGRSGVQPTDFVLMYSLMAMAAQSEESLKAKNQLMLQIQKTKKGPTAAEYATAMGFDSVEAFTKEWLDFIASSDFE